MRRLSGKIKLWFVSCCIITIHGISYAQEFIPKFRQYNNAEGLSQSVVISIFQDSKNFLWFGTEDGLNKFDGYNFKIYRYDPEDSSSISDNWIERIFMEDDDGDIWMQTSDRNINIFNPRTDQFKKIGTSDKGKEGLLPFQRIYFIKQDKDGFVWISTDMGLFRVDKSTWKINRVYVNKTKENPRIFRYLLDDGNYNVILGSNKGLLIWNNKNAVGSEKYKDVAIYGIEKVEDIIWIVTEGTIFGHKNHKPYKTIHYSSLLGPLAEKNPLRVKSLFASVRKDSKNNIWILSRRGLIHFDPRTEKLQGYLNDPLDKSSISSDVVISFYEDKQGNYWFGTVNGLNQFVPAKNNFIRIGFKSGNLTNRVIVSIFEDKTGRIWSKNLMDQNAGSQLFYLDRKSNQIVQVQNKNHDPSGIPLDLVYEPFIDHHGNIWYGTYGSGVLLYSPHQKKFDLIKHIPGNTNSLAGNSSWAISEDNKGKLWIALLQDGMDCYDPITEKTIHYKDKIQSYLGIDNLNILTVLCDKSNNVWFGTTGQGIIRMNIATGQMTQYTNNPGAKNKISSNFIFAITEDIYGNLLLSYPDNGFDILDPETGKVTNYRNIPGNANSLHSNSVRYAIGTSDGNYWISTHGAISFLDRSTNKLTHYVARKMGGQGILSDKASVIFEDSKGNIWVGTHGGGLSLFDKQKKEFKYWVEKNGLINNVVYGILEDKDSKLWLSTNNGLSCFDPQTSKFTNYYANDGLQGSEFNANSFYEDDNGKMYFGGINGITTFYPGEIQTDLVPPQVSITGFQIFNKKVEVLPSDKRGLVSNSADQIIVDEGHIYLPENISYTNKLQLSYNYKVFTFEFAALRFDMPERCTFMYKMEGFEEDWNIAGNRRFATYTNLPPGDYVFKVTAANADGIWNPEPVKMAIIIKPPFYLTWWFISFGIAALILGSTAFVRRREMNLKKTKNILEEKVKLRTHELNEKNEELTLRNIQIIKQKEEIAKQAKRLRDELELQNKTSEQALLRSQINPHFLFNTLNNIYSLVYQKASSAPESIMKLSEIMRYMLYDTSSDRVLLEKEIQYLNSFIELQLLRLKNKSFVSFEVSGDPSGKHIAPMLLIPFVENAFKHGNKSASSPGIDIKLDCTNDKISFKVINSKNNSAVKDSLGGIGLANVKRRLELIYHEKYMLDIIDADDKFNVDLEIREK